MNVFIRLAALVSIVAIPIVACAQQQEEEEEEQQTYSYATYFYCDVHAEDRANEIVESVYAPVYNAAVKDGTILGWGWLAHHTGGKWRRILYHAAPTMEALFGALESIGGALEEYEEATAEFSSICGAHDDYIWQQKAGSGEGSRGAVGFSVYFYCDISDEEDADELVNEVFAPIYDQHLGDGKLASWGWLTHVVGGKYRRLATMTAADINTLMKERASIIEELFENEKAEKFNKICTSHQDYIWEIEIEMP